MNNKQEENNRQKEIGNRIKVLIKEKGFTQSEFAETMNVERETLSGWLNGRRMPSLDTLAVLCENLDVDMDFITGRISCKTHTTQDIQNITGLSEKAIAVLRAEHSFSEGCTIGEHLKAEIDAGIAIVDTSRTYFINKILESDEIDNIFPYVMRLRQVEGKTKMTYEEKVKEILGGKTILAEEEKNYYAQQLGFLVQKIFSK